MVLRTQKMATIQLLMGHSLLKEEECDTLVTNMQTLLWPPTWEEHFLLKKMIEMQSPFSKRYL